MKNVKLGVDEYKVSHLHCISIDVLMQTFAGGVHWALIPETGLNLLGDEAHMLHYRSAPLPKINLCAENVTLNGKNGDGKKEKVVLDAGWIRDMSVSKIYAMAKAFPV